MSATAAATPDNCHEARQPRLLVVEDDRDLREALTDTLLLAGYDVATAGNGVEALRQLQQGPVELVVSDVNMDKMNGHELLKEIHQHYPQIPVMLITAYASIDQSVAAMRAGAVDYLVKPFAPDVLVEAVSRYVNRAGGGDEPVAASTEARQLLALARRVAQSDATVLISGESGTGKEVLARYIHQQSPRAEGPFVALNCAAIPENMLEAMLFGHEKGAFTGAYHSAPGKFEQAEGGTLLLDEISEMPLPLQAKLLRVLQEREVERLGGRKTIQLDVRVVATTNRDMRQQVAAGDFREDLYYRLSVMPLMWSPLRERPEDIVPLAERLLVKHAGKQHRAGVHFTDAAKEALRAHPWPGNVRELDNVVQRALILQPGQGIDRDDLILDQAPPMSAPAAATVTPPAATAVSAPALPTAAGEAEDPAGLGGDLRQREFEIIVKTLQEERGSRKHTAERLGISPRTLRYKLAKLRDEGFNLEAAMGH